MACITPYYVDNPNYPFDYQAAQSSTKIGTVMMTTDYDAADLPPLDK